MTFNLIITTRAELHVVSACNYYEEQLLGLSERFLTELVIAYNKITANPQHYSYISSNPSDKFRDIKLNHFPYVVVFQIDGDDVIVNAVLSTYQERRF